MVYWRSPLRASKALRLPCCPLQGHLAGSITSIQRGLSRVGCSDGQQQSKLINLLQGGSRVTKAAHEAWEQVLRPGDVAIDATCGRGHDTLHLTRILGVSGKIYAFDIQREAIESTKQLLTESLAYSFVGDTGNSTIGPMVHLLNHNHSHMSRFIEDEQVKVVCFNLGYLPKGDKEIMTETRSTLIGIESCMSVILPGGLITIISYIGHEGGLEESEAVRSLVRGLPRDEWVVENLSVVNRLNAPILTLIWKCIK